MLLFYLLLFVIIPFSVIFMLIFNSSDEKKWKIRVLTATIFVKIFGFKAQIEGEIDKDASILVLNHQSDLDVIFFEYFYPKNICWIAKKELGDVPFLGLAMKLPKMILIDRKDKHSVLSMIKSVKERIKEGRVVAVFPEGTRGEGDRFLPFKSGLKPVLEAAKQPIQPVVLIGTRDIFNPKEFKIKSGVFKICFMPSFIPDSNDKKWFLKLKDDMERVYNAKR